MFKDCVYETPMAEKYKVNDLSCECHNHPHRLPPEYVVMPHCDCHVPPQPPYPYPYPPYPCPPVPPTPTPDETPTKVPSVENELCKLSKKASIIVRMINNFETNKKDVIFKIGEVSYNFGGYKKKKENSDTEEVTQYGEEVMQILKLELEAIKTKIGELATEIGDDTSSLTTTYGEVESSVYND